MRKWIIVAALAVLGSNASADTKDNDWDDICRKWGLVAEKIMTSRQLGVSLSDMMAIKLGDKGSSGLIREMTLEAYDSPQYSTEEVQNKVIREFANQTVLKCYKSK